MNNFNIYNALIVKETIFSLGIKKIKLIFLETIKEKNACFTF